MTYRRIERGLWAFCLLITIIVVGVCLAIGLTQPASGATLAPYSHCGTERWHIKTLDDADVPYVHMNPQSTTIADLRASDAPADFSVKNDTHRYDPREMQVYRVRALLVGWKQETDRDLHIVIADPAHPAQTMVAEVPDPSCSTAQQSGHAPTFASVRNAFFTCFGLPSARFANFPGKMVVDLDGLGFFDVDHGQRGRAKLGDSKADIELHPVLRVHTLSGACPKHDPPVQGAM